MTLPHGGNIYHYSGKYGIPVERILDFSASINPLGPSPKAVKAMNAAVPSLANYPDPDCEGLVNALAGYHKIPLESILAGNGSTELIYLLPRALGAKTALVISPGFSDYERAARLAGCKIKRMHLSEGAGFVPDIRNIICAMKGADIMFLCNPNNPTGVLLGREDVLTILAAARKSGTFVVLDEAFMDYQPSRSVIREAVKKGGVACLRNFTKFHGLPGLRIGYLAAHPKVVAKLKAAQEPWSVNTLAQEAAVASLADETYISNSLALIDREKKFLYSGLDAIPGLEPYVPSVNFMLVRLTAGPGAGALTEELASGGILIRDCSNFRGLGDRFIRVAVRSSEENELLVTAIKFTRYFTAG